MNRSSALLFIALTVAGLTATPAAKDGVSFEVTRIATMGHHESTLIGDQVFFKHLRFCRFDLSTETVVQGDNVEDPDCMTGFMRGEGAVLTIDKGYIKILSPETLRVKQKIALPNREELATAHLAVANRRVFVAANYIVASGEMFAEDSLKGVLYCFQGQEIIWQFAGAVGEYFYTPVPFRDKVIQPGSRLYTLESIKGSIVSTVPLEGANGIKQSGNILWIPLRDSLIRYDLNSQTTMKTKYVLRSQNGVIYAPPYMDANYCLLATSYTAFWGSSIVGTSCRLALFTTGGRKLWEKSIPAEVNYQPVIYKDLLFVPINYLNDSKEGKMLVYDLKGNLVKKLYPRQYGWPGAPVVYRDKLYMIGIGGIFRVQVD